MDYNPKGFIKGLCSKGERLDGRKLDEYRNITVELGVSSRSAEGSARVRIGDTEVVAGVKLSADKPYPDRPDEGTIIVNVELLPLASPDFESGPPSIDAIGLSRVVDRGIRESKALNFNKLVIEKGEKVWMVFIDIYPLNNAGNIADAASLAAMAALQDAVFPKYDKKTELVTYEKTTKKLPIERVPISTTILKIGDKLLVDPTVEEEYVADASLMVSTLEKNQVCAMQKHGREPLSINEVDAIVTLSLNKRDILKNALENAR